MITIKLLKLTSVACVAAVACIACIAPAVAQGTAEQRSACMGDAFEFCSSDIPDVSKIEACLKQNRSRLKPACAAEFQTSGRTKIKSDHFR